MALKSWISRLLSVRHVNSSRNGKVSVRYWLGKPTVLVDGYFQSGEYMRELWAESLQHLTSDSNVQKVLMLGLGAGSAVNDIQKRFPQAQLTVFEWDPEMVKLAKELNLYSHNQQPDIVLGDAVLLIKNVKSEFDIVLIDLFKGDQPESRLGGDEFLDSLANAVRTHGLVVLNAFKSPELIAKFSTKFQQVSSWQFCYNELALFENVAEPINAE